MTNEDIFKEAVDVAIRLAKVKWGEKPVKDCLWIDNYGKVYTKKEFAPKHLKVHPSEERWYKELKKHIEQFI